MKSAKTITGVLSATRTNWFRLTATLAVVGLFLAYFFTHTRQFKPLTNINVWFLFAIAVGDVAIIVSNGLLTKLILRSFDKLIALKEASYIALVTSVGNFFAPVGAGLAYRAFYLKRKHNIPYGDYISILTSNYVLVFLVNSFFGILGMLFIDDRSDSHYQLLLTGFLGLFVLAIALLFIKAPKARKQNDKGALFYLSKATSKIAQGWTNMRSRRGLFTQLLGVSTINFLITCLITWTIINSLHLTTSTPAILVFSVLSALSLFINITPANLGIKEAVYLFSAKILGFSFSQIILIALVDRAILFIIMFCAYLVLKISGSYNIQKPVDNLS